MTGDHFPVSRPTTHPVAVVADQTLTADEARYVDAARAANTVRRLPRRLD
ncbi:hypothetical protein [Mycolicibacterium sp.]|nr:hypothetical protein [Mycolicibacterium sp.]MBJ7337242.1 hypothetical protein [Mycolicibacterium sp.]